MGFLEAVQSCFSKYVTFSGRALRSEFWFFTLFVVLGSLVAATLDAVLFGVRGEAGGPVSLIFGLGILLPNLAVSVRRLHDTGRSGWFILLGLIPLIGIIILLIWFCQRGEDGPNAYGPPQLTSGP